jgi:hypothetical protein
MIQNSATHDTITAREYRLVFLWAAVVMLLYGIGGYLGARTLQGYAREAEQIRQARLASETTQPGLRAPARTMSAGIRPVAVRTGIYLNSIGEISLINSTWVADFDIWFRWTGDGVSPGEHFEIVNGQIEQRDKMASFVRGGERYERYRVKARLQKFFDGARFPFSEQSLLIQVEDSIHGAEQLRYDADGRDTVVNRSGVMQSLKLTKTFIAAKLHHYGSLRGDTRLSGSTSAVHSRLVFALLVSPPSTVVYFKMFQALFAAVAIALIVFFIKPTHVDPRFGLGVGALFAAVGNNIFVGTLLPPAESFTLTAMVNAFGLATIFLTLVQSTISLYLLDSLGRERLRVLFDRVSFYVFLAGFLSVNVLLPLAARP